MSEPSCRTKKRPLDLAAVRQKQLQKRRRETSGSGSTAVDEHVQRARGENTSLPGKPPLVTKPSETSFDTYVGGLKNNGASPFELKPETAPEEPEFKLFGKGVLKAPPTAIKRTTSEFPATFLATSDSNFGRTRSTFSVHSGPALPRSHSDICPPSNFNPFSAEATAREEGCVKRRNPFSIFGSKSTADSSERTDGPGLAEIGEHVMTALQAVRRDVPSLSKIHSLPGLISPNVRTSKRSRSDFFAAAHFKDHSDEELSEDEVEAQMSDMEEEDTWWLNEHDEVEADDYQDVRSAKEGDESQSDSPGDEPESPTESKKFGFLDLLAGKILGRSDITEAEIATVTDVAGNSSPPDVPMAHSQSRSEKEPEDLPGSRSAPRTRRCYKIQPSTCFPVDWSLKTHVTLISKTPFKCADQPSSVEEVQHLAEFATKTPPLTEAKTIYPHLYHYIYPPAKPAPAHVALMAKVLTKEADGSPLKEHEGIELEYFKRGVEQ
ncbi:hypothetical protein BC832DRAFT_7443 [Gaertneriomyces semiglobifer]|nr:hypothetical protein BC832DRAFT_7443 [Gaertneriomyces semiglobifer]